MVNERVAYERNLSNSDILKTTYVWSTLWTKRDRKANFTKTMCRNMEPLSAEKTAINTKDNMEINIERTKSILSHLILITFISNFINETKKEK